MLIFSQFYLPTKFIGGLQGYSRAWSKYVGSLLKTPGEEHETEFGVDQRWVRVRRGGAPGGRLSLCDPQDHALGAQLGRHWRGTLGPSRQTRASPPGPGPSSQLGKQRH